MERNTAQNGGAMYLRSGAYLNTGSYSNISMNNNHASLYGGGIYHEDSVSSIQCSLTDNTSGIYIDILPYCFLRYTDIPRYFISNSTNMAEKDGSSLYGGLLDKCRLFVRNTVLSPSLIPFIQGNISVEGKPNIVSSKPYRLCFCTSNMNYNCTGESDLVSYRGEMIAVSLIALGQGNIPVASFVKAVISNTTKLDLHKNFRFLSPECSNFTYTVYSTEEKERLVLHPDGPCYDTGLARAVVNIVFIPCPEAFTLSGERCICEKRLLDYANCTISKQPEIIRKRSMIWINATYNDSGSYQGLIFYDSCPRHYCNVSNRKINLNDPDCQCAFSRSGLLCGGCAIGNSLMLGGSKCKQCSNVYLLLLILFGFSGVFLTAFLIFFRITVATGMINSIILYANIVQVNKRVFFPTDTTNVLTIFIAWMNLDLGFEICFFHGLNEYLQTWLQFAFPLYIWVLIAAVIFGSRYSITISKLIGSNPIAVLATLLLMSYTKVLKIIVEVYSSVELDYPDGRKATVWLKDANVPYLKDRHLVLAVVISVVLVFVFLPYTFLLLIGHKTYRFMGKKYLRCWFGKIRPLLESYYAPYKMHARYWTGLLLLVRCVLYVVFSFNALGGENISLFAIIVAFTGMLILAWLSIRIYKSLIVNIIEASVYLNLVTLSAATLAGMKTESLIYILVGVVFATMIGIVVYHFHLTYTAKSAMWLKIKSIFEKKPEEKTDEGIVETKLEENKIVTTTHVELREPLLEKN